MTGPTLPAPKFSRRIEDFTCGHCGKTITGDGYTNHCPHCLYSRHVDINPGDRAESCGGLMAPVAISNKSGGWVITHRCRSCGAQRPCKTRPEDMDALLQLAAKLADPRNR